jgi:hypothetical protein
MPDVGSNPTTDPTFDDWVKKVDAMQPGYLTKKGRYFQGILTGTPPEEGSTHTPNDKLKPTDQAESYADEKLAFPSDAKCAMGVDVYDGPNGKGYAVFGVYQKDGKTYRRQIGRGSHTKSYDWRDVTQEVD